MAVVYIRIVPSSSAEYLEVVSSSGDWVNLDVAENGYVYASGTVSDINSDSWVQFKAISGYTITECYKSNSSGSSNKGDITVNDDGTTEAIYPWTTGTASTISNYLYVSVEESDTVSYTENLTNCTSDIIVSSFTLNDEITITLTADDNYIFTDTPICTIGETDFYFTVSDDKRTAEITISATDDITVSAWTVYCIDIAYSETLTNCTSNFTGQDTITSLDTVLTLTANDGYSFQNHGTIRVGVITYDVEGNNESIMEIDLDSLGLQSSSTTSVSVEFSAQIIVEEIGTFVNLYYTSEDELSELAKVRFYELDDGSFGDYGEFITALYKLPITIPDDLKAGTSHIILGTYDSNVDSTLLSTYLYEFSLGTITVPEKYNNVYDYVNITIILHLPFLNNVYLNAEYVINQTITLKALLDLYSGILTINIYSTFIDGIIESVQGNIVTQIPFIETKHNSIVNSLSNVNKNLIETPFIEVTRNVPYDNYYNVFGKSTIDYGLIGDHTNYLECEKVKLVSSATNEEYEEILKQLKSGIFINKN